MPRTGAGVFAVVNPVLIGALRSSTSVNQNFTDMGDEITGSLPISGIAGMSAPAPMADGTVGSPSFTFASDTNLGFCRTAPDTMAWVSGGAIRKSINAARLAQHAGNADIADAINLHGGIKIGDLKGLDGLSTTGALLRSGKNVSLDNGTVLVSFDIEARSIFTGASTPLTTGVRADLRVPFNCTLTGIALVVDQVGSVVLDIWRESYANYPPTAGDSICGSSKPTISMLGGMTDEVLAGWSTSVTAGDVLRFNIDSASSVSRLSILLRARRFG